MFAYKKHIIIENPNHLVLTHLPFHPGQRVELVFLAEEEGVEVQRLDLPALFKKPNHFLKLKPSPRKKLPPRLRIIVVVYESFD